MALPLERFLMLYCFPVQLLIGLAGNGLNLLVLTNRRMRSKTNWLLAMVALADSLFLLAFLPHSLIFNHWALRDNPHLRFFLLYANNHITAFVNACSFASAWFIVAVSLERMMAVRWPLHARRLWSSANLRRLVLGIWAFALIASGHSHVTHSVRWTSRNETRRDAESGQIHMEERMALQSSVRPGWERLWRWLTAFSVLFGVLLPVLLVLLSNLAILEALGREQSQRMGSGKCQRASERAKRAASPAPPPSSSSPCPSLILPRPSSIQLRHQRQATLAVLVIACTFTFCQTPSALVFLLEIFWPPVGQLHAFRTAAVLSNFMVVTGKTANHFLLCLRSAHFRQNVRLVLARLLPRPFNCLSSDLLDKKSSPHQNSWERRGRGEGSLPGSRGKGKMPMAKSPSAIVAIKAEGHLNTVRNGSLPAELEKLEAEEGGRANENGNAKLLVHITSP